MWLSMKISKKNYEKKFQWKFSKEIQWNENLNEKFSTSREFRESDFETRSNEKFIWWERAAPLFKQKTKDKRHKTSWMKKKLHEIIHLKNVQGRCPQIETKVNKKCWLEWEDCTAMSFAFVSWQKEIKIDFGNFDLRLSTLPY